MAFAVFDTSIYIGRWEKTLYVTLMDDVTRSHIVRHSSVVLSELRRGASTLAARRLVSALHNRAHDPWAPSAEDWWEAGRLVLEIGDTQGWEIHKRREFQNDALIAVTTRRRGGTVVTANRADFSLLQRATGVELVLA